MLIPKKARVDILSYLFKEGVLVAEKNLYAKHPDIDVPNLYVINVMKSMRSRKYVRVCSFDSLSISPLFPLFNRSYN
jgi:small subunit ribosomal protein S10e